LFVCERSQRVGQLGVNREATEEPPSTNQLDGEATASRKVLDALVVDMPSLGSAMPVAAGPSTTNTAGTADPDDLK